MERISLCRRATVIVNIWTPCSSQPAAEAHNTPQPGPCAQGSALQQCGHMSGSAAPWRRLRGTWCRGLHSVAGQAKCFLCCILVISVSRLCAATPVLSVRGLPGLQHAPLHKFATVQGIALCSRTRVPSLQVIQPAGVGALEGLQGASWHVPQQPGGCQSSVESRVGCSCVA